MPSGQDGIGDQGKQEARRDNSQAQHSGEGAALNTSIPRQHYVEARWMNQALPSATVSVTMSFAIICRIDFDEQNGE